MVYYIIQGIWIWSICVMKGIKADADSVPTQLRKHVRQRVLSWYWIILRLTVLQLQLLGT